MIWHWPQIVISIWIVLELIGALTKEGKAKQNAGSAVIGVLVRLSLIGVYAWMLYRGGFWMGATP